MSIKEQVIAVMQEMPDTATRTEVRERLRLLFAIDEGLEDMRQGRVHAHADVKREFLAWLQK
jgi:predicted transcriptional regulator